MDNVIFWFLWAATLILAGWVVVDATLKPRKLLEWPSLCAVMWLYFYVYMAHDAALHFADIISPEAFIFGQLLPLLSLAAILYGWKRGKAESVGQARPYARLGNPMVIWCIGMTLMVVGSYGGYLVQAGPGGDSFDFENTSAYIYLSFYVGYPGTALSLWVAARTRGSRRVLLFAITFVALGIFIFPHVAGLRRGPTFPAVLLLLLVPPLATRKIPKRTLYLPGLCAAGVLMLAYLPLRVVIYNEGTWEEAFSTLSLSKAVTERGKRAPDNEYINNCHMIEALANNGRYQYGTGHGSLLLHWIPSSIWKDKPALGGGIYTHEELFADVAKSAGIQLLGGGAAAGGVADTFVQYGFFTPLFYGLLGFVVSKAYWKGRREGEVLWVHVYIAVLCASHWLISQGVAAAFVPLFVFLLIPLVVLFFVGDVRPAKRRKFYKKVRWPGREEGEHAATGRRRLPR